MSRERSQRNLDLSLIIFDSLWLLPGSFTLLEFWHFSFARMGVWR